MCYLCVPLPIVVLVMLIYSRRYVCDGECEVVSDSVMSPPPPVGLFSPLRTVVLFGVFLEDFLGFLEL